MNWKGKKLKTIQELMDFGINKCDSPEEAQQFMMQYVIECPHARTNIGYLAGYYDQKDKERIFKWFDVVHPIFGTRTLSNDEMMRIGFEMGRRMADKVDDSSGEDISEINIAEYIKADISFSGVNALIKGVKRSK